jgi:3-oxoacid CoA-transferase
MAAVRAPCFTLARAAISKPLPRLNCTWHGARPRYLAHTSGIRNIHAVAASAVNEDAQPLPVIERGASKVYSSADEAVADIQSGSVILSSGFGLCGVPGTRIPDALLQLHTCEIS